MNSKTSPESAESALNLAKMSEQERSEIYALTAALDYSFYVEYVHRGFYQHGAHTRHVCKVLEAVEAGELDRVMLLMPPRHSKSMTVTETFPSWFIGRNPRRKVIATAYGDSLARRFGRYNRKKIEEYGAEVFGIQLDPASATVTNWSIHKHNGIMVSAGIGGPISGEGADLLIIDDPIKNRQEADSPTYRNMVWDEWQNTLLTRLQPDAAIIIILTRWHEDDLVGRLLADEPARWTVLKFPAIAEDDDILGRSEGDALWPEYGFDEKWAVQKKKGVGSYAWASLYQQRPSPPEGGIFKRTWWKFWEVLPNRFDEVLQSWDMSFGDTKDASFVVGQVWGRKGADKYLLDQVRAHMDFVGAQRAILTLSAKWPSARAKLVEDKANGPAVISSLKKDIPGLIPITPKGSKESRANAASPDIEAGNVYLPLPSIAEWVHDYIEEHAAFPTGRHDDQVDATSQALDRMNGYSQPRTVAGVWGR